MFQTLLESRVTMVEPRRGWTMASAGVHAAIITLVVALTVPNVKSDATTPREVPPLVFVVPPRAAPATQSLAATGPATLPALPSVNLPAVPRFQPSVDFDHVTTISAREIFAEARVSTSSGVTRYTADSVVTADRVDRQVISRSGNGQPRYPEALRASSVEGEVMARFVVDTLGRVEQGSVTILAATHQLFGSEVRTWLLRTSYIPAEYGGRRVRQLVEQRFQFALRR